MTLYLEYVIIDNYIIDYIILRLIEVTTGSKIRKINKILVCLLGSILALFLPYLYGLKLLLTMYRIFTLAVMILCIKKYKKIKEFIMYYLIFMTYTFFIGGVILGLIQLLNIEYTMSGIFMYKFEFPISIFIVIFIAFIKLIFKVINVIKSRLYQSNLMYSIKIKNDETSIETQGFLDTGNCVFYNDTGVNIISLKLFMRLYENIDFLTLLSNESDVKFLKDIRYISIQGIGNKKNYISFLVDDFEVNGESFKNVRLAVAMKDFGEYDCILHKDFVRSL